MLMDRPYMQDNYQRRTTSAVVWLIASIVAAYALQLVMLSSWFHSSSTWGTQLQLTVRSLQSGHFWTLITHSFLHSVANPFHVLFTILGLIFVGRELEPLLGSRRFVAVYTGSVISGALCWAAVHWATGGIHIGATAGILGLFVVLCCLYPDQEIKFLALFLFPVTLRPRYVVYGLIFLNVFGFIFYELMGVTVPFNYAPSVHLGGMLVGWVYFRYFHANNGWDRASTVELPLSRRPHTEPVLPAVVAKKVLSPGELRAEVDVILDKINSRGFSALTDEEKRTLEAAKDLLSRP